MHRVRREQGQFQCTIIWTPGHCGITGNEAADVLAKEVAQGAASMMKRLPETLRDTLPHSKAAVKMTYMKTLRRRAEKHWQQSPRYPRTTKIDDTLSSKWFLGLISELPRKQASLILQLRTGHAPLNRLLHRIGKAPSPICPACEEEDET